MLIIRKRDFINLLINIFSSLFNKGSWGDGVLDINILGLNFWFDPKLMSYKKPTKLIDIGEFTEGITICWKINNNNKKE